MEKQHIPSVPVTTSCQLRYYTRQPLANALGMEVSSFVYEETPLCRFRDVAQAVIGYNFEPIVPRIPG